MGTAHQRKQLIFKTIDELCQKYSISRLCQYFKVSRSGYYAWKNLGKPLYKNYDKELASKIMLLFKERNKGYRYIKLMLCSEGTQEAHRKATKITQIKTQVIPPS